MANWENDKQKYIDGAGFRFPAFVMAIFSPIVFAVIEFFSNQMMMQWKNIAHQYLFTLFYMLVTAAWQFGTGDAVLFPKALDWICHDTETRPYNEDVDHCLWD